MVQRLTLDTRLLKDMVGTLETMYSPNKLYDYSNQVTLYCKREYLICEMCVILDGASNDAMIRLSEPAHEGAQSFDPLTINFDEFRTFVKSIKIDTTTTIEVDGKSITITAGKSKHVMQLSTSTIPTSIVNTLKSFSEQKFVDFNLLKLYNNMNEIAENLTLNTLSAGLFGIMNTPNWLASSDGFSIGAALDYQLPHNFLFPKHALKIFKALPKISARYAIHDHRFACVGSGFELYMGEWSGYKAYPIDAVTKHLEAVYPTVVDGVGALEAIRRCHMFGDLAYVNFGLGIVTNKSKTHTESFTPTPSLGDKEIIIHQEVVPKNAVVESMMVSLEKNVLKIIGAKRVHILLGLKEDTHE